MLNAIVKSIAVSMVSLAMVSTTSGALADATHPNSATRNAGTLIQEQLPAVPDGATLEWYASYPDTSEGKAAAEAKGHQLVEDGVAISFTIIFGNKAPHRWNLWIEVLNR